MAINSQKLLPGSSGTALVKYTGNQIELISTSKTSIRKNTSEKKKEDSLKKDLIVIKTKVISIDKLLKSGLLTSKKSLDLKTKNEKVKKNLNREKKLEEKPKGKGGIKLPSISLPATGFLDSIKRFLFWTILGRLFFQYFNPDNLNKLTGIFRTIGKIGDFVEGTLSTVFSSLVNFIDFSYTKYDEVRGLVKKVGGKKGTEIFDKFSKELNTFINSAIIIGILLSKGKGIPGRGGPGRGGPGRGGTPRGGTPRGGSTKPNVNLRNYLGRDTQSKLIERKYGNNAARIYENARANGKTTAQAQAAVQKALKSGRIVAQEAGEGLAQRGKSSLTKRGLGNAAGRLGTRVLGKGGVKGAISGISKGFGRIPLIGPIVDFLVSVFVFKEKPGRAAAGAVGNAVGTAIGGALGTLIPIPFAGTWLGATGGGILGDILGRSLYDAMVSAPKDEGAEVQKAATGGYISTRGGQLQGSGTRTLRASKINTRPPKYIPEKTVPGKNVGGVKQIEKLYPNPKPDPENPKPNALEALRKTSEILKKTKMVGALMGASVDIALGQKPSKRVYETIGNNISYLIAESADRQAAASMSNLTRAIAGMAGGGSVPNMSTQILDPKAQGEILSKTISNVIEKQLNEAIAIVRKEVIMGTSQFDNQGGGDGGGGGGGGGGGAGGGGGGGTDITKIELGDFSPEDIDALGRMIAAESGNQSKLGKAGVMSVILNRYRLAKAGDRGYMPPGKNKDNVTLKDILYDEGQFSPIRDGRFDRTTSNAGKNALADAISAAGNDPQKFKQLLIKELKLKESDAETVVRATAFSNPKTRSSKPFDTPEVSVGNHSFQESPYSKIGNFPGAIKADVKREIQQVEALSTGFRTGLKTGPAGRIGAGTEYHVDARFMEDLSLKDKIAMMDSMASAHAREGYVMEFSGSGVAGLRWNPNMSKKEKEELAIKVLSSHHTPRPPFQPFDYYIVKRSAKDRFDKSAEGANIMAPMVKGGTYEYQESEGEGRHLIIRDKNGRIIAKILHGDRGMPSPKEIGKSFKMDELSEAKLAARPGSLPGEALFFELHANAPNQQIRTGLIQSYLDPDNPLFEALSSVYGKYPRDFRGGDLGGPKRGLSLIELVAFDRAETNAMLNEKTRAQFIDREAKKLFDALKKDPTRRIKIFAGHADVNTGQTGTSGTAPGTSIGGKTVEQAFTMGVAARVAELAKKEGLTNIEYVTSVLANKDDDPNANWNRAKSMREADRKMIAAQRETQQRQQREAAQRKIAASYNPVYLNGHFWAKNDKNQWVAGGTRKNMVMSNAEFQKRYKESTKPKPKQFWEFWRKADGGPVGNKYNHLQQYPSYSSSGGLIIARQKIYIPMG